MKKIWVAIFLLGLVCSLNGLSDKSSNDATSIESVETSAEQEKEDLEWIKIPDDNLPLNRRNIMKSLSELNLNLNQNRKFKRQIYTPTTRNPWTFQPTTFRNPFQFGSNPTCNWFYNPITKTWSLRCSYKF